MENNNNNNNSNVEEHQSEKSVDNKKSTGELTLEQFKSALENNLECKGYFDSLCDKTVNSRLNKGIESWKEQNLNNLLETEINKRYPKKSETELALEQAQEEKRKLELQLKYQSLITENNLSLDVIDFVSGDNVETTIKNIEKFKSLVDAEVQKVVRERISAGSYVPPRESDATGYGSMWDI